MHMLTSARWQCHGADEWLHYTNTLHFCASLLTTCVLFVLIDFGDANFKKGREYETYIWRKSFGSDLLLLFILRWEVGSSWGCWGSWGSGRLLVVVLSKSRGCYQKQHRTNLTKKIKENWMKYMLFFGQAYIFGK